MDSKDIAGIFGSFLTGGVIATVLTYILKSRKMTGDYRVGEVGRANLRIDKLEKEIEECYSDREALKESVATLKARQEASEENERMLKTRLEALTGVVERQESARITARVECDEQGVITGWNMAAISMFYFTADEAMGSSIDIIIPKNRWAEHHAAFTKSVAGEGIVKPGMGERTIEVHALTRGNEEIPVFVAISSYVRQGQRRFIAKITRR